MGTIHACCLGPALGALSALERLDLFVNRLTGLPEWLGRLKSLRMLDLHSNPIGSLPDSPGDLPALEELCIKDLEIDTLPGWLAQRLPLIYYCDMFLTSQA